MPRLDDTQARYLTRVPGLFARVATDLYGQADFPVSALRVAQWLSDHCHLYTASTIRQNRSALKAFVELDPASSPHHASISQVLDSIDVSRCVRPGKGKTSSGKTKSFPRQDFELIVQALASSEHPINRLAALMLEAILITGARPIELREILFCVGEPTIRVRNAKNTNGRANGDYRYLIIQNEQHYKKMLTALSALDAYLIDNDNLEHHALLLRVDDAIRRARKRLWPRARTGKRYTLYSARHQASAGFKTIHSCADVARLMGHNSDETSGSHYARAVSAWEGQATEFSVQPHALTRYPETQTARSYHSLDFAHSPRPDAGVANPMEDIGHGS
jgi:hypothetical protein